MQNATQYLDRTHSAAAQLFEGIDSYLELLRGHTLSFATSYTNNEDFQSQCNSWHTENQSDIRIALEAQNKYFSESFAQAILCGAVLQLAAKAIECYSKNMTIPPDWRSFIKPGSKPIPFSMGRLVRGVPLGLIIYAGRNQHTHFEDQSLREPNVEVFRRLAINHGYRNCNETSIDPTFDLGTEKISSFANNVTALIGWRSLEAYESDMRNLLGI